MDDSTQVDRNALEQQRQVLDSKAKEKELEEAAAAAVASDNRQVRKIRISSKHDVDTLDRSGKSSTSPDLSASRDSIDSPNGTVKLNDSSSCVCMPAPNVNAVHLPQVSCYPTVLARRKSIKTSFAVLLAHQWNVLPIID